VGDEPRNKVFFNNCYWIYNLETAAKVALALGKPEIAKTYRQRAQAVREAVQQTFFNPADDSYANGGQACLGIALMVTCARGIANRRYGAGSKSRCWSTTRDIFTPGSPAGRC